MMAQETLSELSETVCQTCAVAFAVVFCVKAMQQLNDASLAKQSITNILMLLCAQHETAATPQDNHNSKYMCY